MTPKDVLEHEWKAGEKIWVVCYKYNREITTHKGIFNSEQPVGIVEAEITGIEKHNKYPTHEYISLNYKANWPVNKEKELAYKSTCLCAMVNYRPSGNWYDHSQFCVDKFFKKSDAEKRLKVAIKQWNKKVENFKKSKMNKLAKAKEMYEQLKSEESLDYSKHIIK